jgi:glyoxalase family protein
MARTISGIHHITAIAGDPQRNLEFYSTVLGLRLVKLTVNFDDPTTYHFYFGDASGSPGSILTFFPWRGVPRGRVGNGQVSATTFAAPPGSLDYWTARLRERQVVVQEDAVRFGDRVLRFEDPDGLPLELIEMPQTTTAAIWPGGSVPAQHAIVGFHSATLSEEGYEETARLIGDIMGFRHVATEGTRYRYAARSAAGAGTIVDVVCAPDAPGGRLGTGTVHHIAWRAADNEEQRAWRADLVAAGRNVTPVVDRTYFHSIYFREPGGILFEIATDPPGSRK